MPPDKIRLFIELARFLGPWSPDDIQSWATKRDGVTGNLMVLPELEAAFAARERRPSDTTPQIVNEDVVPRVLLASGVEAATNALYALCEIAARCASRMAARIHVDLPSKFRGIRDKASRGELPAELIAALGDLEWFSRIHELRTEWTHYSSIFVGEDEHGVLLIVRAFRELPNRKHFGDKDTFRVAQVIEWIKKAVEGTDNLAGWLTEAVIIPHLKTVKDMPTTDLVWKDGEPVFDENGQIQARTMSVAQLVQELGVTL